MKLDECELELSDDDVLVVTRIADQGPALLVAWEILGIELLAVDGVGEGVAAREQLHPPEVRVEPLVQVRALGGTASVQGVEVEARGAEVDQAVGSFRS